MASDAIAPQWRSGPPDPLRWPLPPQVVTHPRTAATFGRTLRMLVREQGLLSLPEAVRRCTLVPAQVAQAAAPAMRRKGRLQPGSDADVTVLDPDTVTDMATYTDTTRPSAGIPARARRRPVRRARRRAGHRRTARALSGACGANRQR